MYHLKLVKALSYCGVVKATRQHPDVFVEDKAVAAAAVATGYFRLIEDGEEQPDDGEEKEPGKRLEEMTVPELETFAAYKGVSLKGINRKADIIARLKEELGTEETENGAGYSCSPTMTELQDS